MTIDDRLCVAALPPGARVSREAEDSFAEAEGLVSAAGLRHHAAKRVRNAQHALALGQEFRGDLCLVEVERGRRASLAAISANISKGRVASVALVQRVNSLWAHCIALRRPIFCVLDAAYKEAFVNSRPSRPSSSRLLQPASGSPSAYWIRSR